MTVEDVDEDDVIEVVPTSSEEDRTGDEEDGWVDDAVEETAEQELREPDISHKACYPTYLHPQSVHSGGGLHLYMPSSSPLSLSSTLRAVVRTCSGAPMPDASTKYVGTWTQVIRSRQGT